MVQLGDFIQIIGDSPVHVPSLRDGADFDLPHFDTTLRIGGREAFLIFSVQNLTTSAEVFINGWSVGNINPTSGPFWGTQLIMVGGTTLKSGSNEIVIKNVADPTGFDIKNLICFFHQEAAAP